MTAPAVWRAMNSLLVLRGQVNLIAPLRSKASDGLVGDPAHQATNSDHNPHNVPGVGPAMVTALDLTHDPAHGFDSYAFAETLRRNRDRRIKYVISNRRIFSSYAVGATPAWTWRTYSGDDPHTGHVHVSVLDNAASDTTDPWNLGGFTMTDPAPIWTEQYTAGFFIQALCQLQEAVSIPKAASAHVGPSGYAGYTGPMPIVTLLKGMEADIKAIRDSLANSGGGAGGGDDDTDVLAKIEAVQATVDGLVAGIRANAAAVGQPGAGN